MKKNDHQKLKPAKNKLSAAMIACLQPKRPSYLLVFVDRFFVEEFSSLDDSFVFYDFATSCHLCLPLVQELWVKLHGASPLASFAQSCANDGIYLDIPPATVLKQPIHLLFITTRHSARRQGKFYNMINVGAGCEGSLVAEHESLGAKGYCNNVVTQLMVRERARINYAQCNNLAASASQVETLNITQQAESMVNIHYGANGGNLQGEMRVRLEGESASNKILGWSEVRANERVSIDVMIEHLGSNATSDTLFKSVVHDASVASFVGKIIVPKAVKQSHAKLYNKNLLLGEQALVNTAPALEIYADDVAATHGATVGKLDEEALFYLRTRGLDLAMATTLLTQAFIAEVKDVEKAINN